MGVTDPVKGGECVSDGVADEIPTVIPAVTAIGETVWMSGSTLSVPTSGPMRTVVRVVACVDIAGSSMEGAMGPVTTEVTFTDKGVMTIVETVTTLTTSTVEGSTRVGCRVLVPVTVVVDGEMANVDLVAAALTGVLLGVMEKSAVDEDALTDVVSGGTVVEDGAMGPTTMTAMVADATRAFARSKRARKYPTLLLQRRVIAPDIRCGYGAAWKRRISKAQLLLRNHVAT